MKCDVCRRFFRRERERQTRPGTSAEQNSILRDAVFLGIYDNVNDPRACDAYRNVWSSETLDETLEMYRKETSSNGLAGILILEEHECTVDYEQVVCKFQQTVRSHVRSQKSCHLLLIQFEDKEVAVPMLPTNDFLIFFGSGGKTVIGWH